MKKTPFVVLAIAFLASSASAMPMIGPGKASVSQTVEVKIICEESGFCFKRGRKPVARWVYGEGAFYGPYAGPGSYGNPRYRYSWWPQGWW
ncbi:hypothetical protein [Bradyrhizobium lablabi]|uniref:hypothetical protein n=1 Tax=Bradyrhizobium lablabi TaxID=722472 RepID=UPI000909C9F2|nr:hypothetical protein [Bradyrhizobium lablabi]SHM85054.1 hypothetical protein SAMN05444321_7898 [Bradyrhizobium lablabi]